VSAAVYDETTGMWKLTAYVSCLEVETPSRRLHFIRERPERFSRIEDAEIAGMEIAKNWVDRHLRELG
jgi:hypothetical protein